VYDEVRELIRIWHLLHYRNSEQEPTLYPLTKSIYYMTMTTQYFLDPSNAYTETHIVDAWINPTTHMLSFELVVMMKMILESKPSQVKREKMCNPCSMKC